MYFSQCTCLTTFGLIVVTYAWKTDKVVDCSFVSSSFFCYVRCKYIFLIDKFQLCMCVYILKIHFQWPPEILINACDISPIVKKCYEQCNVTSEEVQRFELTTDYDHLPHSNELKCYLHCVMASCGVFKPNSTRLDIAYMMEIVERLPREEQDIVFAMGRGCVKRIQNMKDPIEIAYTLNVCGKQNDNEVCLENKTKKQNHRFKRK